VTYNLYFSLAKPVTVVPTRLEESDSFELYSGFVQAIDLNDYFKDASSFYVMIDGGTALYCRCEGGNKGERLVDAHKYFYLLFHNKPSFRGLLCFLRVPCLRLLSHQLVKGYFFLLKSFFSQRKGLVIFHEKEFSMSEMRFL